MSPEVRAGAGGRGQRTEGITWARARGGGVGREVSNRRGTDPAWRLSGQWSHPPWEAWWRSCTTQAGQRNPSCGPGDAH